ncbi:MAG: hypothetical protein K1X29_09345 [Bdellovibrionales bacterium]|nr:hypothetical protein [Bdellovibrionales bacterium]
MNKSKSVEVRMLTGAILDGESTNKWSLFNKTRISFLVCLQFDDLKQPVGVAEWEVKGGNNGSVSIFSEENGCLTWQESFDVDPVSQPGYIAIERVIYGKKKEFNPVSVKALVNPWSGLVGSEPAVVNPLLSPLVPRMAFQDSVENLKKGELFFKEVRYEFFSTPMRLNLSLFPQLKTTAMDGKETYIEIKSGVVNLKIQIFYQSNKEKSAVPVSKIIALENLKFEGGLLVLQNLQPDWNGGLSKNAGQYFIQLSGEPVGSAVGMQPFSHTFSVGPYQRLAGGVTPYQPDLAIVMGMEGGKEARSGDTIVGNVRSDVGPMAGSAHLVFSLGKIRGQPGSVNMDQAAGEDPLQRTKLIQFSLPVQPETLSKESLEGRLFTVSSLSDAKNNFSVRVVGGYLIWTDIIKYSYVKRFQPLNFEISVTHVETGKSIKKGFKVTPGENSYFVIDDKIGTNFYGSLVKGTKPFLYLSTTCFENGERTFSIDPGSLALSQVKLYKTFEFTPKVEFLTVFSPDLKSEDLIAGAYQITMAFYSREYFLDGNISTLQKPLAVTRKVIDHIGSTSKAEFEVKFLPIYANMMGFAVIQMDFFDRKKNRVIPKEELGMGPSAQVFEVDINGQGCSVVPARINTKNFLGSSVAKNMIEDPNFNLISIADQWGEEEEGLKQKLIEKNKNQDPRMSSDWNNYAIDMGLTPVELNNQTDLTKYGFTKDTTLSEVEEALDCAYKVNYQKFGNGAKCMYDFKNGNPQFLLYKAITKHWGEELTKQSDKEWNKRIKNDPRMITERIKSLRMSPGTKFIKRQKDLLRDLMSDFYSDPSKVGWVFRVQKFVYPYQLTKLENLSGFGERTTRTIQLKSVVQSIFGYEKLDDIGGVVGTTLSFKKPILSTNGQTNGALVEGAGVDAAGGTMGGSGGGAVGITPHKKFGSDLYSKLDFSKKGGTFRWEAFYETMDTTAAYDQSVDFQMEDIHLNVEFASYRTCYSVEASLNVAAFNEDQKGSSRWKNLNFSLDYNEAYKPKFFFCLPVKNETKTLQETYYFLTNLPPEHSLLLNNKSIINRFFLILRGKNQYDYFIKNLGNQTEKIYRNIWDPEMRITEPVAATFLKIKAQSFLMNQEVYPGLMMDELPTNDSYDTIENLDSWWTGAKRKFRNAVDYYFNPLYAFGNGSYKTPAKRDIFYQNGSECRVYNEQWRDGFPCTGQPEETP